MVNHGSPHPRGDGPRRAQFRFRFRWFSPPTWGWSAHFAGSRSVLGVLPTHVGMVREEKDDDVWVDSSPHPRGDGPSASGVLVCCVLFSPPTWGWSALGTGIGNVVGVLPTHVGMVRAGGIVTKTRYGSPHPRGDGPRCASPVLAVRLFSPPTWGWSGMREAFLRNRLVLPTHVGMVRQSDPLSEHRPGSPHPRGDGPMSCSYVTAARRFSPPTPTI